MPRCQCITADLTAGALAARFLAPRRGAARRRGRAPACGARAARDAAGRGGAGDGRSHRGGGPAGGGGERGGGRCEEGGQAASGWHDGTCCAPSIGPPSSFEYLNSAIDCIAVMHCLVAETSNKRPPARPALVPNAGQAAPPRRLGGRSPRSTRPRSACARRRCSAGEPRPPSLTLARRRKLTTSAGSPSRGCCSCPAPDSSSC
jgi:hypothetical protein